MFFCGGWLLWVLVDFGLVGVFWLVVGGFGVGVGCWDGWKGDKGRKGGDLGGLGSMGIGAFGGGVKLVKEFSSTPNGVLLVISTLYGVFVWVGCTPIGVFLIK